MIALLGVGLGLMLGVAMRITTVSGVVLLIMMWSASCSYWRKPWVAPAAGDAAGARPVR